MSVENSINEISHAACDNVLCFLTEAATAVYKIHLEWKISRDFNASNRLQQYCNARLITVTECGYASQVKCEREACI